MLFGTIFFSAMLCLSLPRTIYAQRNILDFGASANTRTLDAAQANGKAFYNAVVTANTTHSTGVNRTVWIPPGLTFWYIPFGVHSNIENVIVRLDGNLSVFSDIVPANLSLWPNLSSGGLVSVMQFDNPKYLSLTGSGEGAILGNGYLWWWYVILTGILEHHDVHRPQMIVFNTGQHILVEKWRLENSPNMNVVFTDVADVIVRHITVYVDVEGQKTLLKKAGHWKAHEGVALPADSSVLHGKGYNLLADGIPTFPLNTDGIDIAGTRVHVHDVEITNFDDTVVPKPLSRGSTFANCSEGHLYENIKVMYGGGVSVGSVPPNPNVNCIRNVTFRNLELTYPIKAVYLKPNPGTVGTGLIANITYENVYAYMPLTWSIFVGVQQQAQPGLNATSCSFFFPLPGTECPTQPLVPVTYLTLRNVTMVNSLISEGILMCSRKGPPCVGWLFQDVNVTSLTHWPVQGGYLCHGVEETITFSGNATNVRCAPNSSLSERWLK